MSNLEPKLLFKRDWNDAKFQSVLQKISDLSNVDQQGSMSWSDFKIDVYFSLAFEAFEELDEVPSRDLRAIIRTSIIHNRKIGSANARKVISYAKNLIRGYLEKPLIEFSTAIDVAIDLPLESPSKRFKYRDVSLEVTRRLPSFMNKAISNEAYRAPYAAAPNRRYSLIITRCLARTENEAVSKSFEAISIFLGTTNLAVKGWNYFGGEQRPQVLLPQGPYHYVFARRNPTEGQWYNPNYRDQFWRSSKSDGEKFVRASKHVRAALLKLSVHPLREPLANVLATMNEGLESHVMSERMLYFWNAIERLFSDESEKVPYDKIVKRATFLEKDQSEARIFINHLVNMRNHKVHHGKSYDHQHQLLEYTVDLVRRFVFYLIFNGDDFKDHREFLEIADLPSERAALDRRLLSIERRIRFMDTKRHR